jgi:predicted ribosome quality control (RQC) complex YloA/Tae2 family protein
MQGADADAERARLFVAQAAQAPRGATKLTAIDWSSGEARTIEISLDPASGAQEQLAALFKRARRLKEGARIALERLSDAQNARAALAAMVDALAISQDVDLGRLEAQARSAAPRDFRFESAGTSSTGARSRLQAPLPPYRAFTGMSGARILVGRGAAHNDALTFRVASPHHLWLHAKSRTGAHVVVPLDKGQTCPADLLVEAAHLAAHFSEARDEHLVEVQYTPRRYLRKPRGSPPGLVVVDREKVIVLRREDAVLRRLLERETAGS